MTDSLLPLVVIWLCSPDTRRVATIRGRQYHWYNAHVWHLIYLKHLLRLVNYPTQSSCIGGAGGFPTLWGVWGVNLDIWPPIMEQVQASCPSRSGFSCENTSSICWISPLMSFSMIARGTSIHRRVQGDTDPCYDAHLYLKGSAGDLWVAGFGALGLYCSHRSLRVAFVGYFLKLQQYCIMHNDLMGFNLGGTQMTRATAVQQPGPVKSDLLMNVWGWQWVHQLAYEYNRWHLHKAQLHSYLCSVSCKAGHKLTQEDKKFIKTHAESSVISVRITSTAPSYTWHLNLVLYTANCDLIIRSAWVGLSLFQSPKIVSLCSMYFCIFPVSVVTPAIHLIIDVTARWRAVAAAAVLRCTSSGTTRLRWQGRGHVLTCYVAGVTGEQNQPTKASAGKQHKCFLSQKFSHSLVAHIGKLEWSFNKQSCYLVVKWCHFSLFPGRHGNFSRTKGGAALSKEKTKAWHKSAQMKTLIVV